MILGPSPIPEALLDSLTQRVRELTKKAHNHPFCLWSGRQDCTTEQGTSTQL